MARSEEVLKAIGIDSNEVLVRQSSEDQDSV